MGTYVYWKVHIRTFLKSLDEHVWMIIVIRWKCHKTALAQWTKEETSACNWNNKGLNAIFMAISPKEFKQNSNSEVFKEGWDILEVTHEDTKDMRLNFIC